VPLKIILVVLSRVCDGSHPLLNLERNPMEVNEIRVEIRKHHVTPGINVLDLVIDANGENIRRQTQHKDDDKSFAKFVNDITKVAQELADARIE